MLAIVDVFKSIYSVSKTIYDQVKLVKANKKQCYRLVDRIKIIETAVHGLDKIKDKKQYEPGLYNLLKILNDCQTFIQQFTESNRIKRWILKAGTNRDEFQNFTDELQKALTQLGLGMIAKQIIDHEQDKADQAEDFKYLSENIETIKTLGQVTNQGIFDLNEQENQHFKVIVQNLQLQQRGFEALRVEFKKLAPQLSTLGSHQSSASGSFTFTIPRIRFQDIQFDPKQDRLGNGSFGTVYKGLWNQFPVAIKEISGTLSEEIRRDFNHEAEVMFRVKSPWVVNLFGVISEPQRAALVMELMPYGSLNQLLHNGKELPWTIRFQIALDITQGLILLHAAGVLHRDLKSDNVLLDDRLRAKLSDFGFSKVKSTSRATTHRSQTVGTQGWMAPELFLDEEGEDLSIIPQIPYSVYSDIYSYGMVLWEIASRKVPYMGQTASRIEKFTKKGGREGISDTWPRDFSVLIEGAWKQKPEERTALPILLDRLKVLAKVTDEDNRLATQTVSPKNRNQDNFNSNVTITQFQQERMLPDIKVNAETVNAFLKRVAEGEQDEAEKLLKSNQDLVLASGDVTDLAGRSFKNITALQYAVWALDWHMWTMIRKYIPDEKAKEQLQGMEKSSWVQQHGVSASWQNLLDALQKCIDLCNEEKWSEADTQWTKQVGSAQRLLPTHVVNEYCYPDRPFEPCPDFTKGSLPRTRKTAEGEWYTATYHNGKLGDAFAYLRYSFNSAGGRTGASGIAGVGERGAWKRVDLKACHTLLDTRTQQCNQLFADLSVHVTAPPVPMKPHSPVTILNQFQNQRSTPTDIKVNAEALSAFLTLVAEGEQDKAEKLLKSNQELALAPGDVTDLAGRSFKNITAFQYAVWALDWHMWTMIRKYLPNEKAREQLQGMEKGSWVQQHGVSASWQNLLDALQKFIDLCNGGKWDVANTQWKKQVGGAQRLLPMHVVNEYCHPDRLFAPCPDFTKGSLPRSHNADGCEWYKATCNTVKSGELGETFAYLRSSFNPSAWAMGEHQTGQGTVQFMWECMAPNDDLKACRALLNTRAQQRDKLFAELVVQIQAQRKEPILNQFQNQRSTPTDIKVNAETLTTFLTLVVEGEQDKAEALLKSNQELALASGHVKDLAGRWFENITAFQYAVWALDWHMWTMIQKYLPTEKVKEQLLGMEKGSWVKEHGVSASWQNLLDALQKYIDLQGKSKFDKASIQMDKQVASAQRLLPTHVVNEYCHPDRSFDPCPDFIKGSLPRSRKTEEGDWNTATCGYNGMFKLFGYLRSFYGCPQSVMPDTSFMSMGDRSMLFHAAADFKACQALLNDRMRQRDQLFASVHVQAPRKEVQKKRGFFF